MENYVIYSLPYDKEKFEKVIQIIREYDSVFIPGTSYDEKYNIMCYWKTKEENKNIVILLDRNIVTRMLSIFNNEPIPISQEQDKMNRIASATISFLMTGDAIFEPSMSLYEVASKKMNSIANKELNEFRNADNLNPEYYANYALRIINVIPKAAKEIALSKTKRCLNKNIDFEKMLYKYKLHYSFVLKMAIIARDKKMSSVEKFKTYIDWMYNDSIANAIATIYSLFAFSDKRKLTIIKKVNSSLHENVLQGIRNLTWDIAYIDYVKQHSTIDNSNDIYGIASMDKLVHKVLNYLFCETEEETENKFIELINENYNPKDADAIYNMYQQFNSKILISNRKNKKLSYHERLEKIIGEYELELQKSQTAANSG